MSFISVIVPVYNAEQYLEGCLESIRSQSFEDWEVVLIDDGSSDASPQLCDRYAAEDERFRVIHQENAGTSAARNAGIAVAEGEYITFMDNDDWWRDSECLGRVAAEIRRRPVDLVCHMSCRANFDGSELADLERTDFAATVASLPVTEAIRFIVDSGMMTSAVWTKVVRKQLLETHGIVFPTGMRNEDTEWSARVLAVCESIAWLDERFYVYRMGHPYAQTSHKLARSSVTDLEEILARNLRAVELLPVERQHAVKAFLSYPFIVWAGQASALGLFAEDDAQRLRLLSRLGELASYNKTTVSRMARIAARVVGARNAARLLGMAFKKKYPQHNA